MRIDLSVLFSSTLKPQLKGVEVIDSCLSPVSCAKMTMHRTPRKGTPRKRVPPSQIDYVIVDKPSGHCPKCRKFVPDQGVECKGCNAFWHYMCAEVTQSTLDDEWDGKDWFCSRHHHNLINENHDDKSGRVQNREHHNMENNQKEIQIKLKVNSYTLNPTSTVKKLQASLRRTSKIEPRDQNQQYSVNVSQHSRSWLPT